MWNHSPAFGIEHTPQKIVSPILNSCILFSSLLGDVDVLAIAALKIVNILAVWAGFDGVAG